MYWTIPRSEWAIEGTIDSLTREAWEEELLYQMWADSVGYDFPAWSYFGHNHFLEESEA